jgi:hypothetical protein
MPVSWIFSYIWQAKSCFLGAETKNDWNVNKFPYIEVILCTTDFFNCLACPIAVKYK